MLNHSGFPDISVYFSHRTRYRDLLKWICLSSGSLVAQGSKVPGPRLLISPYSLITCIHT